MEPHLEGIVIDGWECFTTLSRCRQSGYNGAIQPLQLSEILAWLQLKDFDDLDDAQLVTLLVLEADRVWLEDYTEKLRSRADPKSRS